MKGQNGSSTLPLALCDSLVFPPPSILVSLKFKLKFLDSERILSKIYTKAISGLNLSIPWV